MWDSRADPKVTLKVVRMTFLLARHDVMLACDLAGIG